MRPRRRITGGLVPPHLTRTVAALVLFGVGCAGGSEAAPRPTAASVTSSSSTTPPLRSTAPTTATTAVTAAVTSTTQPPTSPAATTVTLPATTVPVTATAATTSPPALPAPPAVESSAPVPDPLLGPRTSCREVVHLGDSTSELLWDASTVGGDPAATMEARYLAVGVEEVHNHTSGGRSMVERINRQQRNAIEVAEEIRAAGFHGCWVLMVGTNDAGNVDAGASTGLAARIESMLAVIGGDPVLWVNTSSMSDLRYYGEHQMLAFNAALDDAATRHPNLWVFDWAAVVEPDWYGPDGLHYGATGRAWRTALTAQELAWAFPA